MISRSGKAAEISSRGGAVVSSDSARRQRPDTGLSASWSSEVPQDEAKVGRLVVDTGFLTRTVRNVAVNL